MRTAAQVFQVTDGLDELFAGQGPTMTARDVAELLGVTKQTVHTWLRDGVIPGYKVGTTWFILTSELKETLRKGENAPRVRTSKKNEREG
ncbi:Putative excisionase [Propionibacterium freudenreichii subsp. freudenreichii]|uniref:Putative excisionase n=2 Tax=Propionibacterium freudenreichii TaxID=1744 RepID=A0A0B7NYB4_PROFF|nr:helix-turn-helix domain-containing protein [Propionibacterium freudenreichii]CEP25573.1 Putative excisionase [Propionibacterium freudenreichii subsp. freudenreichii]MDK9331970.1 helix-turn-helix domain-containing protein [Propionibacterium freudenreichii]MDK9351905.1 helix-turn-helix domain-containing protein [Propionibacterium freudenreichii]MDK9676609.1 helix-turn-helix domain-containing protein [Propionibacterium freudenreichii]CEH05327.1 Putative excisionase [Propionibacterium freudenre